jgi:hypothetical protein
MRHHGVLFVIALATTVVAATDCVAAERIAREDLGRRVKLTILVDKVMQPQAQWVTEEWMVKSAADAGFNVFSPRAGYDRLDEVRQVAAWCEKYGIYHMPWMRGTLAAPKGDKADGQRVLWASGNEQPLWSPNSDEFWDWTNRYIIEYARIGTTHTHLMGVFLDYENYAAGKEGNLYWLSYDDKILGQFAQTKSIELPKLGLADRKAWLEKRGLHEEFSAFQIDHWRQRCRTLREAVDRINPTFQFCIYPAPGTPFMVQATYPEWATDRAPIILADASTYGRSSRFLPEQDALAGNREKLLTRMETPRQSDIPFIYAGGIDPVVRGADPEFSGKNAVAISDVTDGYWIFYEGPTYTKQDHADYWKWFTWANRAIANGDFKAQYEARITPEDWKLAVLEGADGTLNLVAPEATGQATEYPTPKLRGENLLLLACQAGQQVEVTLRNRPISRYKSLLFWELRDPNMKPVASEKIAHDQTGTVRFTPTTNGIYMLGVSAGSCAYSPLSSNVPVGLYAGQGLHFIQGVERLYFHVPEALKKFSITVEGDGAETVRVNILDPSGQQVASGQTSRRTSLAKVEVPVGTSAGATWSLQLTRADEGTLEDHSVKLDSKLPPVLSLLPRQVFNQKH